MQPGGRRVVDTAAGDRIDYYVFTLSETQELGLGVRDQSIVLDASVEDSFGNTIIRSWPPPADSSVEWLLVMLDAGTYYIKVEAAEDGGTDYRVRFGLSDPNAIAVGDVRVEEGEGASLDFAVSLDRSRGRLTTISVRYATEDGTAQPGSDYTATSGTLTFEHGESSKTVSVPVLDDSHDEGEETLTLRPSSASGRRSRTARRPGRFANADPLPKALLARFGRTAAVHVVEHVEERLQAPREPGFRGRFAGRELRRGMECDIALGFLCQLGGTGGYPPAGIDGAASGATVGGARPMGTPGLGGSGPRMAAAGPMGGMNGRPSRWEASRSGGADRRHGRSGRAEGRGARTADSFGGKLLSMSLGHDPLTGSSFALNRETKRGGVLSFWSRGARSHFAGQQGALSLGGDVRTTMFGADYAKGPLVAGLSAGHSRGLG